jgi:hypothetical protein
MHVSEARVAANRLNALKSSGPRTVEGKEVSRRNAFKHGLTGEGVVVSDDDREEIERRAEALAGEFAPKSPTGAMMVRKMATLSVRSERAAVRELAAVATKVRAAVDDFDEARVDRANALFDALAEAPRLNLRRLMKSPEGVDRLIQGWNDLRDDLHVGDWDEPQCDKLAHLCGERASVARLRPIGAVGLALAGDPSFLPASAAAHASEDALFDWAVGQMQQRIAAEIAALEAHRATLDLTTIELDRLDAPALALFDNSKEANLARRYEAAAHRGFFQALRELRRAEAEYAAKPEAAPQPGLQPPAGTDPGMGSSFRSSVPDASHRSNPEPLVRSTPHEVARDPEGHPVLVGRAPEMTLRGS